MHNYAPVLIGTLSRYEHFKRCVESLAECTHAEKTDLYIALDYPLNESHWDGYKQIANYVNKIEGFKAVVIIKRDKNYGVLRNYNEAQQEIFNKYDRIIVSEDDNEFSPNFLNYINSGLTKYKQNDDIFAICGYNYPIDIPKSYNANIYMWKGFSGWGCGFWRNKLNKVNFSVDELNGFLKKLNNIRKLNRYAGHYLPALLNILKKKHMTGDTAFCMHIIKNNMYCVFPVISKVRNYGHDGTGVHCGFSNNFCNQIIDKNISFIFNDIPECEYYNKAIYKKLKRYFRRSLKGNIRTLFNYLELFPKQICGIQKLWLRIHYEIGKKQKG